MSMVLKFNNKEMDSKGLVCMMDSAEGGLCLMEVMGNIETIDATGRININGKEIPDGCVEIDNGRGKCEIVMPRMPWEELDLNKIHIEINIFGEVATE